MNRRTLGERDTERWRWRRTDQGRVSAYLLHRVVHGHEGLQPLAVQEVGKLHVDGPHGARVLHDPVLVHVGGVVVTRGAGGR